jgi:hypothetical protein
MSQEERLQKQKQWNPFWFAQVSGEITMDDLTRAYNYGMIKKTSLVDQQWYYGLSRCSSFAQWSKEDDCFYVTTSSMGIQYGEAAKHPEDDNGFALFIPLTEIKELDPIHLAKPSRARK